VNIKVLPNKDLLITVGNQERAWIKDEMHCRYWGTLVDLFEPYFTNGSYEPFDAGDGNPFVGLTSSPCIAECLDWHDDGKREIVGGLWWYPSYMVQDPLEDLKNTGRTVFEHVGEAA